MKVGSLLNTYREHTGLTLRELADEIGISHPTLLRIECGKEVDGSTMIKLFLWLFS
jgi:transcriptional regulator with XRE-family HTH domain